MLQPSGENVGQPSKWLFLVRWAGVAASAVDGITATSANSNVPSWKRRVLLSGDQSLLPFGLSVAVTCRRFAPVGSMVQISSPPVLDPSFVVKEMRVPSGDHDGKRT